MNLRNLAMKTLTALFLGTSILLPGLSQAGPLTLSTVPLDVQEGVPPNVLLTMDDSGSMSWSFVPDGIVNNYQLDAVKSSSYNKIYYNPNQTYTPAVDKDGKPYPNASFTAAWINGFDTAAGTVDLSTSYSPTWGYNGYSWACGYYGPGTYGVFCPNTDTLAPNPQKGYYYTYNGSGSVTANSSYTKHIVGTTSDITPGTTAQQEQNFANWYSYYRTRILMAKTSAGKAFSSVNYATRVAYQALNTSATIGLFNAFTGSNRSNFFSWLYALTPGGGTPLRSAMVRAGKDFSSSGINSPYAKDPGMVDAPEYSCRQNFQFVFTDGEWNGDMPSSPSIDNYDDNTHTLPSTVLGVSSYTPQSPYKDDNSNYLADIAMYYWVNDLRPTLTNNVPTYIKDSNSYDFNHDGTITDDEKFRSPLNDPADWQHMVTYTIGLGVAGLLNFPTDYTALLDGSKSWPKGNQATSGNTGNGPEQVDDLWHAGVNGRGAYFNASNPQQLVNSFQSALNNQASRNASSTSSATSLPVYQAGTLLYQPSYNTGDWSGNMQAKDIITLAPQWNAQTRLAAQVSGTGPARNIITYNPTTKTGIPFTWSSLPGTLKNDLNKDSKGTADNRGDQRVDYLRGNATYEQKNGGTFRNRTTALGDIVDSTPNYVGPPDRVYPDTIEPTSPYSAFKATYKNRQPMLYVGANDGLLHAFNAKTGDEDFAYAPAVLFPELSALTDPAYQHRFYVDGSPTEGDAFFNNSWHSVLVGGLNAGGQGIYALDITNPSTFSETNANGMVLWEFTDADDADLGYTFSQPRIVKTNSGQWVAIFGNGYNNTVADGHASTTGDAVLYIVNISNGALIAKLDTGVGSSKDPTGKGRPNGLATVTPVDLNGDYKADYVYAGDLFGNLWKFDISDPNPSKWTVVGKSGTPSPLFIAKDSLGNPQPITTAPVVNYHPTQSGLLVGFGTGKYLEASDLTDTSQQSMYVVWDRMESNLTTVTRVSLKQQKVLFQSTSQFGQTLARVTSDYSFNWYLGKGLPTGGAVPSYLGWYLDLPDAGERQIYAPFLRGGRLIFNSIVPTSNPCLAGGYSWLNELDFATGKRLSISPFNYNGGGVINQADLVKVNFDVNGDGKIDAKDVVPGSSIRNVNDGKTSNFTILLNPNSGGTSGTSGTSGKGGKGGKGGIGGGSCTETKMANGLNSTKPVTVTESCSIEKLGRRSWHQFIFN